MMRWLKTMQLNRSFVLLALLMNYSPSVNTTSSTIAPTLVSATTNTVNSATSITFNIDKASSCNNTTTQVTANRERSAKISSERIKDFPCNEEFSTQSSQFQPRRTGTGRARDNKLMSILQTRRRSPTRSNINKECESSCSSSDDYCKLKCNQNVKLFAARSGKNNLAASRNSDANEMTTSNKNLVQSIQEEFLDTEESVHGLYFAEPVSNTTKIKQTKESSNRSNSRNIFTTDDKRVLKEKLISELSSAAISADSLSTTTELVAKINRRNKYTRTSFPPFESRSTVYRGRVKFSPSNMRTAEEIDSDPYSYIGQKISSPSTRVPEVRRKLQGKKTQFYQSTTPSRLKEEELEVMEVSVAKQSSTEKSRFWKARNVIAINNYMKRLSPQLSNSSSKGENVTKLTTVKYDTVHVQPVQSAPSVVATNEADIKNIFSRSTSNSSRVESQDNVSANDSGFKTRTFYNSAKMPSLIINVPDDATPVLFNDQTDAILSEENLESFSEETSTQNDLPTSPISILGDPDIESKTHDDDLKIFKNTNINLNSVVSQKPFTTSKTIIPSSTQSTTIPERATSSIEPSETFKTTKRIYTTIPRRKTLTTVYPDFNRTTISTFLSNISSKRNKSNGSSGKMTTEQTFTQTSSPSTTSTVPMVQPTSTRTLSQPDLEIEASSSMIPVSIVPITPTSQINVFEQGVFTTSKSVNNEILVEMYQMNTATYVMAGLGLLPLVVILVCVVRQYLYRHHHDKHSESYGNDIQPISPVVTLDQNDDNVSVNEEESTISEPDFNRSNLRFKSLLGEGNFGQVWKAEADNLMGHIGTTRIIAVKTERTNNGQGGLKSECEIMRRLGSHANVVTLLGACIEQEPHLLLMEYAMRGRLLSLLRAARGVLNGLHHPSSRQPVMPLSPRRLTGFALDIAKGMEYIAEKKVVHRDLAARNVLLDHNGVCKICDFGMSVDLSKIKSPQRQLKIPRVSTYQNKFKFDMTARVFGGLKQYTSSKPRNENDTNKSRPALPIRWMAPEALQYHIYSVETDIFAFGIVLWELSTLGITPYPTLSGREVLRNVPNGVRPEVPSSCRQELSETMLQCWHKDPNQRPSFTESKNKLARALLQEEKWQEETTTNTPGYIDVSGFSEDYENGMIYFNRRVSEFECEI